MKLDKEIVIAAVGRTPGPFDYLKKNKKYVLAAVRHGLLFWCIDPSIQEDEDVMLGALKKSANVFKGIAETSKTNDDELKRCYKQMDFATSFWQEMQSKKGLAMLVTRMEKFGRKLILKFKMILKLFKS